jgi:hypothetical protein
VPLLLPVLLFLLLVLLVPPCGVVLWAEVIVDSCLSGRIAGPPVWVWLGVLN